MMAHNRVLIFAEWFFPGHKAGGPITSVVNFVQQLKDELEIFVFTSDRDLGDHQAYEGISTDRWVDGGRYQVYYASPGKLTRKLLAAVIREVRPDIIYLNSMYSPYFTILPLFLARGGRRNIKVVLSPRGMLRASALAHKPVKKKIFLLLGRISGILKHVNFHATDEQEASDIRSVFGGRVRISVMGNLPGNQPEFIPPVSKEVGKVKLIFVGRVHPIKNLLVLLEAVRKSKSEVTMTIVGPMEDLQYGQACQSVIQRMGKNVKVHLLESVARDAVLSLLREHHLFVLPTSGENFGHAIFEALGAGRPVLISDQTPWRDLERKYAGWDISLSQPQQFTELIDRVGGMDQEEHLKWCEGAWSFCSDYLRENHLKQKYIGLFGGAEPRVH